jgi:hypothetical protein
MKTTPVNYQFKKKGFVWSWVGVNIIGTYIGLITAFGLDVGFARYWTLPAEWATYLENHSLLKAFPTVAAVAGGILVGNLVIGLGEQMIIRRHTHLATLWFLATAIVAVIIAVYSMLSAQPGYYFLTNEIIRLNLFPLLWLFNGLLQWLVMRKMVTRSGIWIWITILSSLGFLVIFLPLAYIAFVVIMDITDGGDYYHVLEPYVHDTTEMSNILDYYFALFVLPIPVVVSALIRGSFIKNRLQKSAQKLD